MFFGVGRGGFPSALDHRCELPRGHGRSAPASSCRAFSSRHQPPCWKRRSL